MNQAGYASKGPQCFGTSKRSISLFNYQPLSSIFEMMIYPDQALMTPEESIVILQQNGNSVKALKEILF